MGWRGLSRESRLRELNLQRPHDWKECFKSEKGKRSSGAGGQRNRQDAAGWGWWHKVGLTQAVLSHIENAEHSLRIVLCKAGWGDKIISVVCKDHSGTLKCFIICEQEKREYFLKRQRYKKEGSFVIFLWICQHCQWPLSSWSSIPLVLFSKLDCVFRSLEKHRRIF